MAWINWTGTIGNLITNASENVTGDVIITLISITIILIILALALKIPLEFTAAIILPMMIVTMIQYGEFIIIGGLTAIYLAGILTKMLLSWLT